MSSDQFNGQTPNFKELAFLRKNLKGLKAQSGNGHGKKLFIPKGMIDPKPCVICGEVYDRYAIGAKEKHENCPSCRKKLASGMSVVICKVGANGLVDGRYAFMEHDGSEIGEKLAGQIIGIMPHEMDLMQAQAEGRTIKLRCPGCGFNETIVKAEHEPEEAVAVEALCPKCRDESSPVPVYFNVAVEII